MPILGPLVAPNDPLKQNLVHNLKPPLFRTGDGKLYILGTDEIGRDLLSRIIYGSRISLLVGIAAVILASTIGTVVGIASALRGGLVDLLLMRLVDMQLSIPYILLVILFVAVIGPGLFNIIIVLGLTGWLQYARIIRGEALKVRELEYVDAARAIGASNLRILFCHVLPNVSSTAIVFGTLELARVILLEASLGFLGLSVQPPIPTWGNLIGTGRSYIWVAPWLVTYPGLAIAITVLGFNLVGDFARDVLDPRLRKGR